MSMPHPVPVHRAPSGAFAALFATLSATLLVSCGGGGVVPSNGVQVRALSAEYGARKAVAYSPFRTSNRDTETVTAAMVKQDLDPLVAGNFRLIRLFDSSDAVAKLVLQVIHDNALDLKVQLGVYVAAGNEAFSQAEIARGVSLANAYPETVLAVSVGNETMVSWSFNAIPPAKMATYLAKVRDGIRQPVTTDDNWAFFASAPAGVLQAIDFVALHTYPLADSVSDPTSWDWKQSAVAPDLRAAAMMDAALAKAKKDYAAARTYLDAQGYTFLPIVIGETGWKAVATGGEIYRAHPVNAKMFLDRLEAWRQTGTGPRTIVTFQAFDEPWKGGDDGWGLFDVNRKARYAVQNLYPATQWAPGAYTAADAVYYLPTVANTPITANRFTLYAETVTAGEARPAQAPIWNAWQNGTTAVAAEVASTASEGSKCIQITPRPLAWGWGMAMAFTLGSEDVTNFRASGYLNFSIRTTYPGTLEVGFLTGTAADASLWDVYIPLASGSYGYLNDGAWHDVRIPIADLIPHGAMSSGMTDPNKAKLDLATLMNPFVVADRYSVTGKPANSAITTPVLVDNIYWSK